MSAVTPAASHPTLDHLGQVIAVSSLTGVLQGVVTHVCFKALSPWVGGGMAAIAMTLSFLVVPLINACGYNTAPDTFKAFWTVAVLNVSMTVLTHIFFATVFTTPLLLPAMATTVGANLLTLYLTTP